MRTAVELPNVHRAAIILEYRGLVVVHIQVVRSREDSYQRWESSVKTLLVHSETCVLGLVCSDNRQEFVLLEKLAGC